MKKTYNGKIRPTSLVVLKNENNSIGLYASLTFLFIFLPLAIVRHWPLVLLQAGTLCLIATWFNPGQPLYEFKLATMIFLNFLLAILAVSKARAGLAS